MILRTALLVLGMTMGYGVAFSQQVPHNYEMGPQVTDCDSLKLEDMSQEIQIKVIEDAKFRLVKNFKLNRKQGFQGAWFYSCNGREGYLVARVDGRKKLYGRLTLEAWETFVSSGDFEHYLEELFPPE